MTEVQPHPVDYTTLAKGDVISVARLEQILGVARTHQRFAFKVLRLKRRIERELMKLGNRFTLAVVKGDLRVLTDPEAAAYTHVEQEHARRRERRRFVQQVAVDVTNLDEDQRKQHERNLEIDGRYIQAQGSVRKLIRLEAVKRSVPGLPK